MHPYEIEDREYRDSPRIWDATPGVCCAYFQTGACTHTEACGEDAYDDLSDAELAEMRAMEAAMDRRIAAANESPSDIEYPF